MFWFGNSFNHSDTMELTKKKKYEPLERALYRKSKIKAKYFHSTQGDPFVYIIKIVFVYWNYLINKSKITMWITYIHNVNANISSGEGAFIYFFLLIIASIYWIKTQIDHLQNYVKMSFGMCNGSFFSLIWFRLSK